MSNKMRMDMPEWQALQDHQDTMSETHLRDLFSSDQRRFDDFHIALEGMLFDYSKHHITPETVGLLTSLAEACDLEAMRDRLFAGEAVNKTENRAALHTALRAEDSSEQKYVQESLQKVESLCSEIRDHSDTEDVIILGIGGSISGSRVVCETLNFLSDGPRIHFLSNVDGHQTGKTLEAVAPGKTALFIVSKTFTTLETMANAAVFKDKISSENIYAITENKAAALGFGIEEERILDLRDWIGGRYSVWSAVGIPVALSVGFERFKQLLKGARAADDHFRTAPLDQNIPVLMALLGIWYRNFWDYKAHAILPYGEAFKFFPSYIQQLDMESNGKSVDRKGQSVPYGTSPVVFGDVGTHSQHTFFQNLHQGSDITPADFIVVAKPNHGIKKHHDILVANAFAQSQALMMGKEDHQEPHRNFEGNRPSSTFLLNEITPHSLGMLMAFYEHKIFVQGVLWNVESFDQWGVELGKTLARDLLDYMQSNQDVKNVDSSTQSLMKAVKNINS